MMQDNAIYHGCQWVRTNTVIWPLEKDLLYPPHPLQSSTCFHIRAYLQQMELRLQGTEKKQQQMMSFLARTMQNPKFIHQLVQQKEKRKELEEVMSKKRRRPIEAGESSRMNPMKSESSNFGDRGYGFEVSELEPLALEMQRFVRAKWEEDDGKEDLEQLGSWDKELDEGFWEELLNEGFDKEGEEEDANVLADRLGFLGSSPK